jgi:hypothetical protein
MLVTSNLSMISSRWLGSFLPFDGVFAPADVGGLPLPSRDLASLSRCRLSRRRRSSSESKGLPLRSTTEESELRRGRRSYVLLSSIGSANISRTASCPRGFPPLRSLCCSSCDRDGRCTVLPFTGGGAFSVRIGPLAALCGSKGRAGLFVPGWSYMLSVLFLER